MQNNKGTLVIGVKMGTSVFIGDNIVIRVEKHNSSGSWVKFIITAPKDVKILREKVLNEINKLSDTSVDQ